MANFETQRNTIECFLLGNNYAESGTVTSDADVKKGTILVRNSGKNWVPADSTSISSGKGIGVAVTDIEKGSDIACDIGISGRFNRNLLILDGNEITDEQSDILRDQTIFAFAINDISK